MKNGTKSLIVAAFPVAVIAGYLAGATGGEARPDPIPEPAAGREYDGLSLSLDRIMELNPAVAEHYGHVAIAPCKPEMGLHWAPLVDGRPTGEPSVVLSVNPVTREVVAAEVIVAPDQPWQPWFDQAEGEEPTEIAPGIHAWTQHVYLVDPSTVDDCPGSSAGAGDGGNP
jgi:hypothetical protein